MKERTMSAMILTDHKTFLEFEVSEQNILELKNAVNQAKEEDGNVVLTINSDGKEIDVVASDILIPVTEVMLYNN